MSPYGESEIARRSRISIDRKGNAPRALALETVGDVHFWWGTTAPLAAGASVALYLTVDGTAGSPNAFSRVPLIQVLGSSTTIVSAVGPDSPTSTMFNLSSGVTFSVKWLSANQVFSVTVTNNGSATTDFVVIAIGV